VSLDWQYRGLRACLLENEVLRVTVLPDCGARIHEMIDKRTDRDLLYHHPRVEVRAPVFGVSIDDWWSGGIDEGIPTGHRCEVDGEELPFMGEVWSMPWTVERHDDRAVRFTRSGVITPFNLERVMELRANEPCVRMSHRVRNTGMQAIRFLWGLHPVVPLGAETMIQVPGARGIVETSHPDNRLGIPGLEYAWPARDLTHPSAEPDGTWDYHYITDLADGWLAVWDRSEQTGFGVVFPKEVFRSVWIWLVNGGWRGIRCVGVEPWTGYPGRLDKAITAGNAVTLAPGEELACETKLVAFQTSVPIEGFALDGTPIVARV
jgi:galactose mutarotase-like enzyme